jgi:hypothetical protein
MAVWIIKAVKCQATLIPAIGHVERDIPTSFRVRYRNLIPLHGQIKKIVHMPKTMYTAHCTPEHPAPHFNKSLLRGWKCT